jgi:hypothetical protein
MQPKLTCDRLIPGCGFWLVIMEMKVQHRVSSVTSLHTVYVVNYQCHSGRSLPRSLLKLKVELGIHSVDRRIVAAPDQDVVVRRHLVSIQS